VEPDADAEAIFWDVKVDDGGENDLVLSNYVRIKIFTDRGRENQSNISIPFISGTKIKDVAARTIKPDGSIIELRKEDILEKTVVKVSGLKLRTKTFAFQGLEVGGIIEYKWKEVISNSSANNLRLQFQRDIPIQSVTYRIKPASEFSVREFNMERPQFVKEKNGFYAATVTKLRAFHEEPMMPPEDSVRSWAMVKYNSLFSSFLGYPILASTVFVGFQPYLKVDNEIKRKAAELTADATTPEQKLDKIFTFCRTNIKNTDSKNTGLSDDELEKLKENKKPADTLKRGIGPGVDINLLFAALANAAGFEARIALLPDRGKRFFDRNVFIPGALRPSNIAVQVGRTWKFFDPGFQYLTPGMLRWQEEGVDALIADDTSHWVKTPISLPQQSKEKRTATFRLDAEGTIEGDVTVEYTGHLAVERKLINDDDSDVQREETLKDAMKERLSSAELSNIVIENVTDPAKPFIYKYHVRVPNYATRTGKRLFLQPAFFQKGISALFNASERKYPIYFHYPWSEEDKVEIVLPPGYALDNADRPSPITAGETCRYDVQMGVTVDEKVLVYKRSLVFGTTTELLTFAVENYPLVKRLFDEINKADNHVITLKEKAGN